MEDLSVQEFFLRRESCRKLIFKIFQTPPPRQKSNCPPLTIGVNIVQEIEKEIMYQECFISTLSSCFDLLANSVNFEAEFCVFVPWVSEAVLAQIETFVSDKLRSVRLKAIASSLWPQTVAISL